MSSFALRAAVSGAVALAALGLASGQASAAAGPSPGAPQAQVNLMSLRPANRIDLAVGVTGGERFVGQERWSNSRGQVWQLEPDGSSFRLRSGFNGDYDYCLTATGAVGHQVVIQKCRGSVDQSWFFFHYGASYEVANSGTNSCLSVTAEGPGHGLITDKCSGTRKENWLPVMQLTD